MLLIASYQSGDHAYYPKFLKELFILSQEHVHVRYIDHFSALKLFTEKLLVGKINNTELGESNLYGF